MTDDPASKDGLRWEIRRSLIERLRIRWDAMGEMGNQQRYEASVQISLMMDELEGWKAAMQKAERDIATLRAERDEARRELCYWWDYSERRWKLKNAHKFRPTAVEWADITGWDCFKEKP